MFFERLQKLCKQKNTTPTRLAIELGLSNATAVHWKKGATPNGETLLKISNFFDVSIDYLLGKEEKPTGQSTDELATYTAEEKILLACYNQATEADKRVLWALLDKYLSANEKQYLLQYDPNDRAEAN